MGDKGIDWESKLVSGEDVLWTGRPDRTRKMRLPQIASLLFGVPVLLAGLYMLIGSGGDLFLLSIGVVPLGFGAFALFAGFVREPRRRQATRYVLTNKRGFIIIDSADGGSHDWRNITGDSYLRLDEEAGDLGSVWFHQEQVNRSGEAGGSRTHNFGFQQIPDAAKVHAMIQGIQQRLKVPRSRQILDGLLDIDGE